MSAKDQFDDLAAMLQDMEAEFSGVGGAPAPAAPKPAPAVPKPFSPEPAAAPAPPPGPAPTGAPGESLDAWMNFLGSPGSAPGAAPGGAEGAGKGPADDDSSANEGDDEEGIIAAAEKAAAAKPPTDEAAMFGDLSLDTGAGASKMLAGELTDAGDAASPDVGDAPPPAVAASDSDGPRMDGPEEVIVSGALLKKGDYRWNDRWFTLTTEKLMYHDKKDGPVKGSILATDMTRVYHTEDAKEVKKQKNAFGLVTPQRTYFFATGTDSARQQWIVAFQRVIDAQEERRKYQREQATRVREHRVGHMRKRQGTSGRWPRRYFVLTDDKVLYYNDNKTKLRGSVPLRTLTGIAPDAGAGKDHCLNITTTSRSLHVSCSTAADADGWLKAIEAVIPGKHSKGPVTAPPASDIKMEGVLKLKDGDFVGQRLMMLTDEAIYFADKKSKTMIKSRIDTNEIVSVEANDTGARPRFGFRLTLVQTTMVLYAEDAEGLSKWVHELRRVCTVPPFPETPYECWRIWRAAYERGHMAIFMAYKAGGHSTKFTFDKLLEIGLPSVDDLVLPPTPEAHAYSNKDQDVAIELSDKRTTDPATGKHLTGVVSLSRRTNGPGWQCVSESWTKVVAQITEMRRKKAAS